MRQGKYYFQTYKYPYTHQVKTIIKMIFVAVTTFSEFLWWINYIMVANFGM